MASRPTQTAESVNKVIDRVLLTLVAPLMQRPKGKLYQINPKEPLERG